MSTTKAFEIPKTAKAARIKNRFTPASAPPTGAPSPAVKDDLLSRIGTDRKHDISDGIPTTIDVFPDFRWILMCIMYYSNLYYSTIDIKNRAKTSPLTVCCYFLVIVNAHLLISDLFLRHTPSYWANDFMNDSARREYLEFILSLPVPDILMKFLETLAETRDPRRPHLQFVCTAAAFSFYHDNGRFFTPVSFLQAHTLAATVSARGDVDSVVSKFLDSYAYGTWKNGMIFGQHMTSDSNSLDYASKLFQSFTSLFNPVVERSIQRRNTFAPTPVSHYDAQTKETFNPYIAMLHATDCDISEMMTVLESVSKALDSVLTFKGQLGSLYDNLTGLDILRHGYSSFALPTWHSAEVLVPTPSKPVKIQNAKERATTLHFLQEPEPKNSKDLKYPQDDSKIHKLLYLVKKVSKNEDFPDPTDFRTFSPRYDVNPRVRVLDPYDLNVSSLSTVVFCGLIIESLEIDGSIVLHPDVEATLDECNSQVLQSAVPLSIIRRAAHVASPDIRYRVDAVERVQHKHNHQKAGISFIDAGENRLGTFDLSAEEDVPTELPAFRTRAHTTWFSRMYTYIAYKTTSRDVDPDESDPRVDNGRVILWSPYRFVSDKWTVKTQAPHVFMLANMRTNYGMNVPLAEIAHPSDLIPIN